MYGNASCRKRQSAIQAKIESIPIAMHRMGWTISAKLMERWLSSPAWQLPESWKKHAYDRQYSPLHMDDRIVRMDWAMRHLRLKSKLDELRTKMANDAALIVLRERVSDLRWGSDNCANFGSREHAAACLEDTCQANSLPFGENLDVMDDMYGSLGKATLKVALVGKAKRDVKLGKVFFKVSHAGFYIRDTYDFNGAQNLGIWTENGVMSKGHWLVKVIGDGLTFNWGRPEGQLSNGDFELYRRATGFGGDFVIYSDVHWEPVSLLLDLS